MSLQGARDHPQAKRPTMRLRPMHRLAPYSAKRIGACCLLALLSHAGVGALHRNPGSRICSLQQQQQQQSTEQNQHQHQQHQQHHHRHQQQQPTTNAAGLFDITGGANANNRRRKHHPSRTGHGYASAGGGEDPALIPDALEVSGADLAKGATHLDGVYLREWDVNGAPHFKRRSKVRGKGRQKEEGTCVRRDTDFCGWWPKQRKRGSDVLSTEGRRQRASEVGK